MRAKIAVASRDADGFYTNKLIGGRVDESSSDQVDGTIVWDASDDARLTVNAYFLDFEGPSTNYNHVNGPTDYRDNVRMNVIGRQAFEYTGANAKFEFPLDSINTKVTAIGAYDKRELEVCQRRRLPVARHRARERQRHRQDVHRRAALRHAVLRHVLDADRPVCEPRGIRRDLQRRRSCRPRATANTFSERSGDTYSIFATGLWRFAEDWELSAGVRVDEEDREQDSRTTISTLPGVVLTDPHREIDSSEVEPRVSLTRFLTKDAMVYGSVAKGYRGGGFNAASVPPQFSTYDGDTVWTYELGGKASSADGRWLVSSAVYYNDYTDFIGQNALAIGPGGGLVSIDLNLGDVESYGLETEVVASINDYLEAERQRHADARAYHRSERLARGHRHAARDRSAAVPARLECEPQLGSDGAGRHGRRLLESRRGGQGQPPGLELRSDDAVDTRELHHREHVGHVSPQRLQRERVREQPVRRGVLRVASSTARCSRRSAC